MSICTGSAGVSRRRPWCFFLGGFVAVATGDLCQAYVPNVPRAAQAPQSQSSTFGPAPPRVCLHGESTVEYSVTGGVAAQWGSLRLPVAPLAASSSIMGWEADYLGVRGAARREMLLQDMVGYFESVGMDVRACMQVVRRLPANHVADYWPAWRRNCDCLLSLGFSPPSVTTILQRSNQFLHELDPEADVRSTAFYLWEDLGLDSWRKIGAGHRNWQKHKYKIMTLAPEIMRRQEEGGIRETVATLQQVGMPTNYILDAAFHFPSLLCVAPSVIFLVSAYLSSKEVGFKAKELGALYRRNPWLLHAKTVEQLRPIMSFLSEQVGVQRLHVFLRGYPQVVMRSVEHDLQPRAALLQSMGIPLREIGRMAESFPALFSLDTDDQMLPVLYYLQAELGLSRYDLWMMLRMFPATLSLSVEDNMKPVVRFLRNDMGVRDVRRFVQRLPPVLGLPVERELRKKFEFLQEMGLGVADVEAFPGYFSHPLYDRIIPRLTFLKEKQRPINGVLLRVALTTGDEAFARDLARATIEEYSAFVTNYKAVRRREKDRRRVSRDLHC